MSNGQDEFIPPKPIDPRSGLDEEYLSPKPFEIDTDPAPSMDVLRIAGSRMATGPQNVGEYFGKGSKYDEHITREDLPNIERERALLQPWSAKAFNSVVGGVASGVMTAAEDIGYVLDLENNVKRIAGIEQVDSNWFSDIMKKGKEGLNVGMPIYRQTQRVFDWSDPGFYWSSLKGVLDSAVGFAIPGALAVKGVTALQKVGRLSRYLNFMKASPQIQKITNTIGSGYITNFGESKMMGVELYENAMKELEANLLEENYKRLLERAGPDADIGAVRRQAMVETQEELDGGVREDYEQFAGKEANKFMFRNKAFAVSDMFGLHGLYKGKGATDALLKKRGLRTTVKNLGTLSADNLALQSLKEGAEEIGQNVIQMEGEYQTQMRAGFESESPADFRSRAIEFATSEQAMLEGMMGLFGGGPQRIGTKLFTGAYTPEAKAAHDQRYNDQQDQIKANAQYLSSKLSYFSTSQLLRDQANERGDDITNQLLRDEAFVQLATENFLRGTTGQLRRSIEDVARGRVSEEVVTENGWDPGYQEKAEKQLEDLAAMEKQWLSFTGMYDQGKIFSNRQRRRVLGLSLKGINDEIDAIKIRIQTDEEAGVPADPKDAQELKEGDIARLGAVDAMIGLDKHYNNMISDEYQEKQKRKEKAEKKRAREIVAENKAKDKAAKEKEKEEARQNNSERKANESGDPVKKGEKIRKTAKTVVDKVKKTVRRKDPEDTTTAEDTDGEKAPKKPTGKKGPKDEGTVGGKSPFVGKSPAPKKVYDDPNKQAIRDEMKDIGDELLDTFTSESPAAVEEEEPISIRRHKAILKLLDRAGKLLEEDPTFGDIIDVLVEDNNEEKIAPIFTQLEGIYLQINPKYTPTLNLGLFRNLTPAERVELEGAKTVADTVIVTQYTEKKDEDVEDENDDARRDMQTVNQPPQTEEKSISTDYKRINKGASVFAYLSRAYDFVYNEGSYDREEFTDLLNENIGDLDLLDPTKYTKGTPITLKVLHDANDTVAYVDGEMGKETTWGTKKNDWDILLKKGRKNGGITKAQYDKMYLEQVPIGIYNSDDKLVSYLHETPWINEYNVLGDVEEDRNRSREIRAHIINSKNGEYKTTVLNKSTGYLFLSSEGYIPLSQAFEDKDLELFIGDDDLRRLGEDKTDIVEGEFISKSGRKLLDGVLYAALPIVPGKTEAETKKIGVPLKSSKLEEYPEIISSIVKAVEIFYAHRERSEKDQDFADRVLDQMGFDITQQDGFTSYVNTFIRDLDIGQAKNLGKYVSGSAYGDYENDAFVSMQWKKDGDVNFQIARGRGTGEVRVKGDDGEFIYLSRHSIAAMDEKSRSSHYVNLIDQIQDELSRVFLHANLVQLNLGGNVITISEEGDIQGEDYKEFVRDRFRSKFMSQNIGTAEKPNHVYTIQPVIEIDFQDIGEIKEEGEEDPAADFNALMDDPAGRIKAWLKEANDPKTTPERKAELDKLINEDYMGGTEGLISEEERTARVRAEKKRLEEEGDPEGRIIKPTVTPVEEEKPEEKKKPKYKKTKFNIDPDDSVFTGDSSLDPFTSEAARALPPDELQAIKDKAEVDADLSVDVEGKKHYVRKSGVLINDMDAAKTKQVVNYLQATATNEMTIAEGGEIDLDELLRNEEANFTETLNDTIDNLEEAEKAKDEESIRKFRATIRGMQQILNNYEKISALVKTKLDKIASAAEDPEIDPEDETLTRDEKTEKQSQDWGGEGHYTLNPVRGLAPELKFFFSGMGRYKIGKKGKPIKDMSYFGTHQPMSYEEIYNIIKRLAANKEASFEVLMNHLQQYTEGEKLKTYPFMKELVKKLRGADEQVKMQFVVGITGHNHNMQHIEFGKKKKNSRSTALVLFKSNANEVTQTIIDDWNKALVANSTIADRSGDGTSVIRAEDRKYITETFREWKKQGAAPPDEEVRKYLQVAGVFLTDKGFNDLMNGQIRFGRKKKAASSLHKKGGLLQIINEWFVATGDDPIIEGYEFTKNTALKALARHDADYIVNAYSNSFRTGRRTVHSFGQNKFIVTRMRRLTEFNDGVNTEIQALGDLPFNKKSLWREGLTEEPKVEGSNVYRENLDRFVYSLEPLKRKGTTDQDNREMSKLSEDAIEVTKIGMLQSGNTDRSGSNQRVINLSYFTTSDKSSANGITAPAQTMAVDENGNLEKESIDMIYEYVVQPEINRIQTYQSQPPKNRPDAEGYSEGGAEMFHFLPLLNQIDGMFNNGTLNSNIGSPTMRAKIDAVIRKYIQHMVKEKMDFWAETGITTEDSAPYLDGPYLEGKYNGLNTPMKQFRSAEGKVKTVVHDDIKVKVAATDMVFQYLIGHAEMAKMFTGDPAFYYKQAAKNKGKKRSDVEYDYVADSEATFLNMGKRLAADIAPGIELAESTYDEYLQIFGADAKTSSVMKFELTKILDGDVHFDKIKSMDDEAALKYARENDLVSKNYYNIDSTDAQEYTTWREHLYVMLHLGEISRKDHDKAYKVFRQQELGKNVKLDKTIMGKIMQPMKPVYVGNIANQKQGIDRRIYIKSSSFPLIPELTVGTQLDNLRLAMTDVKKNKDKAKRFAFSTAVKVGNFTKPVNIFDADGRIKAPEDIDFTNSMIKLKRKDFRIQQKVPYNPDVLDINRVTQATKNLLVNMLGVEGFHVPWYKNDREINGAKLQEIYSEQFRQIHKLERDELESQLRTKNGGINVEKLKDILRKEARDRNFPIADQEMLELVDNLKSIPFSPSSDKYEALLNSIVYSRVVKFTMPGKSFVLGAEAGLKSFEEAKESGLLSGITYTKNWNGKELLPARDDKNGNRRGAQVFIPWKLRNQEDELIDMSKYIIKDEDDNPILDTTKMPDGILEIFGMRIPNQGPNSQAYIEIAGFLPEASGDLMIATQDFVAQMGSDFDVDKLYTYMYNLYENDDKGIGIHRFEEFPEGTSQKIIKKAKIRDLQNKIIDIHLAVHKNTDPIVKAQIANPLGEWRLKEFADKIEKYHGIRKEQVEAENFFTGISDAYQRSKFKSGSVGKQAVSAFSLDSMFIAVAQGKDLGFEREIEGDREDYKVVFGDVTSTGELSGERTLEGTASNGKTFRSDVVNGYQSAALDHEKLQVLNRINVNSHTFNVVKVMNALGFEEETVMFINQDIIVAYVKELERLNSPLAEFNPNRKAEAKKIVLERFGIDTEEDVVKSLANADASAERMEEYIRDGAEAPFYKEAQYALLNKFITLDQLGGKLLSVQAAINVDSKGFGKSVMEAQIKEDQIYTLENSKIRNVNDLVGEIRTDIQPEEVAELREDGWIVPDADAYGNIYGIKSTTINGHALAYGLMTNNDMWSKIFPYKTPGVDKMLDKLEKITKGGRGDSSSSSKADRKLKNWKQLKSYIYATNTLGLFDEGTTLSDERERLLYDRYEKGVRIKNSLAIIVKAIQETGIGSTHPFLSKLETKIEIAGKPSLITYRASRAEDLDETEMYTEFLSLITAKDANGKSPVLTRVDEKGNEVEIIFSGEPYTMQKLGQDLITYSYITGGVQEALQFVKYIPAAYLTSIPFAKRLSDMRFIEKDFAIDGDESIAMENLYSIPPFIEQNIQHFPDSVPQITIKEALNRDIPKSSNFTSFSIDELTLNKIGQSNGEKGKLPPPYISINIGRSVSGLRLFKFDVESGFYVWIDTLGSTGVSEYNRDVAKGQDQLSLINQNKSPVPPENRPGAIGVSDRMPDEINIAQSRKTSTKDSTLIDISEGIGEEGGWKNGVNKSRSILNHIINNVNDPYLALLGTELLDKIDLLPSDMQLLVGKPANEEQSDGRYNYAKNELTLFDGYKKEDGSNAFDERHVARTFEHEVIHGITGYKIIFYEALDILDNKKATKAEREEAIGAVAALKARGYVESAKERAAVKSLKTLFNQAKAELVDKKGKSKAYKDFIQRQAANRGVSEAEVGEFYGLKDLKEFVTMAMTNRDFQKALDEIDAPSGKTFWEALKERIIKLLEAMGFEAREGSVLYQAIHDVLDLVEAAPSKKVTDIGHYKGIRVEEGNINNTRSNQGTAVFGTAKYNTKFNTIVVNNLTIQKGFDEKVWEKVRLQPDDSATKPVDADFITFEQWKDFVIESELQRQTTPIEKDEKYADYEDRITALALENRNRRKVDQKVYLFPDEYGTPLYYRVTFENNVLRKVETSAENPNNWTEMNIDSGRKMYQDIIDKKAEEVTTQTLSESQFVTDNKVITPTKEQVVALDKMKNFLDSDSKIFTLAGYAGTGKTTIMRKAIEDYKGKMVVAAPNHKAKNKISNSTKKEGKTVHKLLGLRKKGDEWVVNPKNMTIQNYDLVIIDEASMINAKNYDLIKEHATGKVIFLGDEGQHTPIGETESKVFKEAKKGKDYALLEEVQRVQGSNPLIDIYTAIRRNLGLKGGGYKREDMLSPTGEGVMFLNDTDTMMDKIRQMFTSPEYNDDPNYVKVIARTNRKVDSINADIREMLYEKPDVIEEGETFVAEETLHVDGEIVIESDVEYLVTSKTPTVRNGYKGWDVTIHVIDEGRNIMKNLFIVDHTDRASMEQYKLRYDFYKEQAATQGKFPQFAAFKAKNLVLRDWGTAKRSINYSYAVNTHKVEGSTYEHVFIYEDDINTLPPNVKETPDVIEGINRALYVAMSRPRKTATVFIGEKKKKTSTGNNFVTEAKLPKDQPGTTKAPPKNTGGSPFTKMDNVTPDRVGMKNTEDLKDSDMVGYLNLDVSDGYEYAEPTGSIENESAITPPEDFITDAEVEEFMKQCK